MKRVLFTGVLIVFCMVSFAQGRQYNEVMLETIQLMNSATTVGSLQQAANQFEQIGNTMRTLWLPYYYSAYCYVQISHKVESDQLKDLNVDKAIELNNIADRLSPDNSEIYVMKGFILQARMNVDRWTRGFRYNSECLEMFERAKELDPENPRSYLWHGVNLFNTPSYMGGGKKRAKVLLETAMDKFNTFKLKSPVYPDWGREYAEKILAECNR
jgi:tetratricopeptide (TPR) repeat protein